MAVSENMSVTGLLSDGKIIAETSGDTLLHTVEDPGVYRVEAWLEIRANRDLGSIPIRFICDSREPITGILPAASE
jgi:hypothetical protein